MRYRYRHRYCGVELPGYRYRYLVLIYLSTGIGIVVLIYLTFGISIVGLIYLDIATVFGIDILLITEPTSSGIMSKLGHSCLCLAHIFKDR